MKFNDILQAEIDDTKIKGYSVWETQLVLVTETVAIPLEYHSAELAFQDYIKLVERNTGRTSNPSARAVKAILPS